jgi:hypothetical protein
MGIKISAVKRFLPWRSTSGLPNEVSRPLDGFAALVENLEAESRV